MGFYQQKFSMMTTLQGLAITRHQLNKLGMAACRKEKMYIQSVYLNAKRGCHENEFTQSHHQNYYPHFQKR